LFRLICYFYWSEKIANLLADIQRYEALRMTAISNRLPHEGHCRLVFLLPSTWRDIVWIITNVGEQPQCILSFPSFFLIKPGIHSFHRMCQSIFLEESCSIFSGLRKVLIGNTIITCLESIHRANKCTFSNWYSLFHNTRN